MALDSGNSLSTVSVVIGGLVGLFTVLGYQNRRTRLSAIGSTFNDVVELLASDDAERQLAGAILLRRFFDPSSELGIRAGRHRRAPYAEEARNVMAAVLRGVPRGDLQKLLADGLAHAETLEKTDLQRTNLQNAYLALERHRDSFPALCSLEGADFYRADLSGASLKGLNARGAVFYQARLHGTVLRGADLREANFFEADLSGASFKGAHLAGASFDGARNIPEELVPKIDRKTKKYSSSDPAPALRESVAKRPRVFLSAPSDRTAAHDSFCAWLAEQLGREGLVLESFPHCDYPSSAALAEIGRRLAGCAGMAVLGLRPVGADPTVASAGVTPWTHVEAGMAYGRGLPLLLLRERGVNTGVFDHAVDGLYTHVVDLEDRWNEETMLNALAPWMFEVASNNRCA
jgi:hypothetical protein